MYLITKASFGFSSIYDALALGAVGVGRNRDTIVDDPALPEIPARLALTWSEDRPLTPRKIEPFLRPPDDPRAGIFASVLADGNLSAIEEFEDYGYVVYEVAPGGALIEAAGGGAVSVFGTLASGLPDADGLQGEKIVTYGDDALGDAVRDAGGVPLALPLGELLTALQVGVVDGVISSDTAFFGGLEGQGFTLFSADLSADGLANFSEADPADSPDPDPNPDPDPDPPDGDGEDDPPDGGGPDAPDDIDPALIYGLGGKFDGAFNQAAFEGAERWADATGKPYSDFELQSLGQAEQGLRRFAELGHDPVVAVGFALSAAAATVAAEFPDTTFAVIDAVVERPNVGSYTFNVHEGAYVMGVIAAAATSSGTVGFVGGMDVPLSRDYAEAFAEGVTDARPGATVLSNMTGTTPAAWNDPVKGAGLAQLQIAQAADVTFAPAGGTAIGVFQAVADHNASAGAGAVLAIANDINQNAQFPGSILTSLVKRVDLVVEEIFTNGVSPGENEWGFADGGWSYALDENNVAILTPDARAAADAAIASFISSDPVDPPSGGEVRGTSHPEQLDGTDSGELLSGLGGDDTLAGGMGNDTLDGGDGSDTGAYSGARSAHTVTLSTSGITVEDRRDGRDGTDRLSSIEALTFNGEDWPLAIFSDVASLSEAAFREFVEVYIAYFNRAPDAEGLFFYGTAFANGTSLEQSAATFLNSSEYEAAYPPGLSNREFAEAVYNNVLGRIPDPLGLDFWVSVLDSGARTRDVFILEVLKGAKAPPPADATQEFIDQKADDVAYLANKTDLGVYFAVTKGMSNVANATTAMQLFDDGEQADIDAAVAAIDSFYADALDPENGEFLLPLVGVVDDPFAVA